MDSNDKLLKATTEAAGLDSSRALMKVYMKIKKEILSELENKRQRLKLQVAEMRVEVMERRGELNLLDERIKQAEQYLESRRQYQAQLVRAVEAEKARRNMIVKSYEEVIDRLQETWKSYLEIYNRFPLAQNKAALEKESKLRKFQLKVGAQRKKDMQHILDSMLEMKMLIRESREKKMTTLRATIDKDKARAAELFTIKQEKLELLARLKADKEAKEREKQQLCAAGPSGPPFLQATLTTARSPGLLSQQTYGQAPVLSQVTQIPRSQMQMLPASPKNTVLMSFNRRIIEERCVVVVSPRPDTTTSTSPVPTVNDSTVVQNNSIGVQDSCIVNGQGTTFDEPVEVTTGGNLVDLEYGGSDSSQSPSEDIFSQNTPTAEFAQRQETCSSQYLESIGTPSAPISLENIQSQTRSMHIIATRTSSHQCTSSTPHSAPASTHPKPTDCEKAAEPIIVTLSSCPNFVTPTTKASPAYATPLPQMRSVASASTTPRPTHQNVPPPASAPRPALQNIASRVPAPIQQHVTCATPRLAHHYEASPATTSRSQPIANKAGSQNAAPNLCKPKPHLPRFHPYMSAQNGACGKPGSSSSDYSVSQCVSQPPSVVRPCAAENPTMGDRRASSQPALPARNAVTLQARREPTPPAKTQANFVPRKSPSTATQKTMIATTQQAANEERKPEDSSSEDEKSHYFNRQALVSENQQVTILDPEKENNDHTQASAANSDQDSRMSEVGQNFDHKGYDDFDMGDDLTSPPFPKHDVEISPPRVFTSPLSDFGTTETENAVGGANLGFSSLFGNPFGGSNNAAAPNTPTPFTFAAAPTTNIFKLF